MAPSGIGGTGTTRHGTSRRREGELRILAEALLEVKGEGEGLWFAGAKWRPTANMVAMERAGGHEGE